MNESRLPHLLPVLALGFSCQIGQVVLLREFLMVFHGNELSFGIILGAWTVWVGVGSRITGRVREQTDEVLAMSVIAAAVLVTFPVTIAVIRGLRSFFPVQPGAYLSVVDMLVAATLVTAPVGLLLGAQFVLLARAWRRSDRAFDTAAADRTYVAEALGNAVGGLLFALLLVHLIGSFQAIVGVGLAMAVTGLLCSRGRRRPLLWGMVLVAIASVPVLPLIDSWAYESQWRTLAPRHELVGVRHSRYGAVSVLRREDQYSFFQSGNLLFSLAGPEASDPALEEQDAVVSAHLAMAQHPDPRRVLLVGGGMRGLLREVVRYPVERVDYVELDPVVTSTAVEYTGEQTRLALERDEVGLVHGDGRLFMRRVDRRYDLIFVDAPDPSTAVLNRFYTVEFFREAAGALSDGGVLVITAGSTGDARGVEIANRNATIFHTLKRVFAHVLVVGERNLHFFATEAAGTISEDPARLTARYHAAGIATPGFSARQFELLLEPGPLRRVNWILRHHGRSDDAHLSAPDTGPLFAPPVAEQEREEPTLPPVRERFFINTDFRPIGYVHTLAYWNQLTRAAHAAVLRGVLRVRPWWIVPPVGLSLVLAVVFPLVRREPPRSPVGRYPLLVAVFTTGLSTMSLQVALLFAFQSVYGFVYEMVGLIVAGFMAGLALGAWCIHRFVRDRANPRLLMGVQLAISICAALIAFALPRTAGIESAAIRFAFFLLVTFAAGFLNGVDFPIAAALCLKTGSRAERATGTVYGLELFGACAGSLVAGIAVAPVLGIVAACLLAAIANGTAFLVLLTGRVVHAARYS